MSDQDWRAGWWYLRPGETAEEHVARLKADPRWTSEDERSAPAGKATSASWLATTAPSSAEPGTPAAKPQDGTAKSLRGGSATATATTPPLTSASGDEE